MLIITHNGEKVTLTHVLIHVCIRLVSMKIQKQYTKKFGMRSHTEQLTAGSVMHVRSYLTTHMNEDDSVGPFRLYCVL